MVRSMTGYGKGEESGFNHRVSVEIRALNHRYFTPAIKIPRELASLEDKIRQLLQGSIFRGRIELQVTLEAGDGEKQSVVVDEALAASYFKSLHRMQELLALPEKEYTAEELARFPGVLNVEKKEADPASLEPFLERAVLKAVSSLVHHRKEEGGRLKEDITARLQKIEGLVERIKEKSPLVTEEYRRKLAARLDELFESSDYDRQRFTMEAVLFAERCNIEEELVRLDSHVQVFSREISRDESVGRKLDFILQEMNREVNTVTVKSSDLEISHLAVEAKSEIEKIREQVQNIE